MITKKYEIINNNIKISTDITGCGIMLSTDLLINGYKIDEKYWGLF